MAGIRLGSIGAFSAAHLAGFGLVEKSKPNLVEEMEPADADGMGGSGMTRGVGGS